MLTFPVNRLAEFWATRGQLRKDYPDMIKRSRCVKSGQSGGWGRRPRYSIRHNLEGGIIRRAGASNGETLLGLVEQETIELCLRAQIGSPIPSGSLKWPGPQSHSSRMKGFYAGKNLRTRERSLA